MKLFRFVRCLTRQDAEFYTNEKHTDLSRKILDNSLPDTFCKLHASLGWPAFKRNNMHYVSDTVLLYAVGNTVVLLDTVTLHKQTMQAFGRGGVGALCVRPCFMLLLSVHVFV